MAQNDPYTSAVFGLADTSTHEFDGSDSDTGAAIISGIAGNGDAEIRIQAYNGTSWVTTTLLADDSGSTTFSNNWHTQFNRLLVNGGGSPVSGDIRVQITNVSGASIDVSADGDER